MNLLDIKRQYKEGIICKKEFIDIMHARHSLLFESENKRLKKLDMFRDILHTTQLFMKHQQY